MFANRLLHPYIDILKLFAQGDWSQAQVQGEVQQVIDKAIGKRVFQLQGLVSASNFLALPRAGCPPLGLSGSYLYLQLCVHVGHLYSLHIDVITDRK